MLVCRRGIPLSIDIWKPVQLEFWNWLLCNVTMSIKSVVCCYHLGLVFWERNGHRTYAFPISVDDFRWTDVGLNDRRLLFLLCEWTFPLNSLSQKEHWIIRLFTLCVVPKPKVKEIMDFKMMEKLVWLKCSIQPNSKITGSILFLYFAVKPFSSKANKCINK